MNSEPDFDEAAEVAKDIEAFAQLTIQHVEQAVDDGAIAPTYAPEALLLAAVELAARHSGDAGQVADWLDRVASRLRDHIEPGLGSVQ